MNSHASNSLLFEEERRVASNGGYMEPLLHQRPGAVARRHNNAMNRPNRGVPGMKERRPSGEPGLAEVGPPVILSLDVAGYCSVRRRRQRAQFIAGLLIAALTSACASSHGSTIVLHPDGLVKLTGTFSDLRLVEDQGMVGMEVRIANAATEPFQAVVQFGMGSFCERSPDPPMACHRLTDLVLVTADFDGEDLSFLLPSGGPVEGKFVGRVLKDRLTGTLSLPSGRAMAVSLPRGPSHWDRP